MNGKAESLWCPIPATIHPRWEQFERDTIGWAAEMRLGEARPSLETLERIGAGELAGRVIARSQSAEAIQLYADTLLWLFAFDDRYCDAGAYRADPLAMAILVAEATRVIETGRVSSTDRCLAALADLRRRFRELASPAQFTRWASAFRGYLGYQVWEAAFRAADALPSLEQYLVARIRSGSVELCVMALDIAGGYEVPEADLQRPDVAAMVEAVCLLIGLDNDLLSYSKEHRGTGDVVNIVDVVSGHDKVADPQAAWQISLSVRDRIMDLFLRSREHVGPSVSAPTRRFIDDMSNWVRGNLDWSLSSARYGVGAVSITDQRPFVAADPLPGVASWWEVLPCTQTTTPRTSPTGSA